MQALARLSGQGNSGINQVNHGHTVLISPTEKVFKTPKNAGAVTIKEGKK